MIRFLFFQKSDKSFLRLLAFFLLRQKISQTSAALDAYSTFQKSKLFPKKSHINLHMVFHRVTVIAPDFLENLLLA